MGDVTPVSRGESEVNFQTAVLFASTRRNMTSWSQTGCNLASLETGDGKKSKKEGMEPAASPLCIELHAQGDNTKKSHHHISIPELSEISGNPNATEMRTTGLEPTTFRSQKAKSDGLTAKPSVRIHTCGCKTLPWHIIPPR